MSYTWQILQIIAGVRSFEILLLMHVIGRDLF